MNFGDADFFRLRGEVQHEEVDPVDLTVDHAVVDSLFDDEVDVFDRFPRGDAEVMPRWYPDLVMHSFA